MKTPPPNNVIPFTPASQPRLTSPLRALSQPPPMAPTGVALFEKLRRLAKSRPAVVIVMEQIADILIDKYTGGAQWQKRRAP